MPILCGVESTIMEFETVSPNNRSFLKSLSRDHGSPVGDISKPKFLNEIAHSEFKLVQSFHTPGWNLDCLVSHHG